MSPSRVPEGQQRGCIVPIGGAEKKIGDEGILQRFAELCGGRSARIAVLPTASEAPDTGERYEAIFRGLNVDEVAVLTFEDRNACKKPEPLERLRRSTGVFLSGGNQLRLSTTVGGTPVAKTIRSMNASGVHVAGTSAGAAFLSEHMIAFGDEGSTPRAGMVSLSPGLGLTNRIVVDQHFRQRDRLGRLLAALSYNPFAVGLGLDEDSAAIIGPDDTLEVVGSGGIIVVDPSEIEYTSADATRRGEPVCVLGVRLHVLAPGATFNLDTREAFAPKRGDDRAAGS